jgi:spore coat protein U-like protein
LFTGLLSAAPHCIAAQVIGAVRRFRHGGARLHHRDHEPGIRVLSGGGRGADVLATSTIQITCELGDTYTIGLNDGVNRAGGQRRMARTSAPVNYLNYNVFQDAARTLPWGDNGGSRVSAVGTGGAQSYTVFGQLPGAQVVPAGAYVDTVTVTVRN